MMTVGDRINDICKKSGFSENIVRAVLNAERESVLESLRRGEKATLVGRCTLVPTIRTRLVNTEMRMETYVSVAAKPSSVIKAEMEKVSSYESTEDNTDVEVNRNIAVYQIASLV